jgi:dTDP-L-rhamnose 4-epimerase
MVIINNQRKKVLVTGGAGFIGSRLCQKLYEKDFSVTVLDNLSSQIHGSERESDLLKSIKNNTKFVLGDLRDKPLLENVLKGQEIIVHLAADTGTSQSMYDVDRYTDTNIKGTACLLEAVLGGKTAVKKIVLASSRAVYGEGKYQCNIHGIVYPDARSESCLLRKDFTPKCPYCKSSVAQLPTDEASAIKPSSVYGITKYAQEQLVNLISTTLVIPAVILRYQNVYGPGQSMVNPHTGIIPIFSNLLKKGSEVNIFEDGLESRDFVYIDDVVAATVLAVETPAVKTTNVFNVGSGESRTLIEVAKLLQKLYCSASTIRVSGDFRSGDIRHNVADLTKIKQAFGFKPLVKFSDGIACFVDWVMRMT